MHTVSEVRPVLVVFDSLADFLAASGVDENSNTDVSLWFSRVVRPLKDAGISVLILDHTPKDSEGPRGAGAKKAKVDVLWIQKVTQKFNREKTGEITLKLSKDREGWLPKTAKFSMGGGVFTPSGIIEEPGTDDLTDSQRKILDFLEGRGSEGATWGELEAEIGSKGTLSRAINELARRNLISKREKHYYHSKAEPETGVRKARQGGSTGFHKGFTEPAEPGTTGEVPQVPPPSRGGTVEPGACSPNGGTNPEEVAKFLKHPPAWFLEQAEVCAREGALERLIHPLASAVSVELYGSPFRWREIVPAVRVSLAGGVHR